jgi:beta-aspartyl-peptidase (threonine type)
LANSLEADQLRCAAAKICGVPKPAIIVHGGAGWIQDHVWPDYQRGTTAAARVGQQLLNEGGSALDAVIAASIALENDPTFNAGYGSSLTLPGSIENDAFVMTSDLRTGAVASVTGIRNPVLAARAVMEHTPHALLAGPGAVQFALSMGVEGCAVEDLTTPRRREQWQELVGKGRSFAESFFLESAQEPPSEPTPERGDTIGACAIDVDGNIAVASSTGGIMLKLPGRVGDTPVVGCGSYCGPAGAVTCTGHGEAAMRICLAKYVYDGLAQGVSAHEAACQGIDHLVKTVEGFVGVIVLDAMGRRAWATSTTRIAVGVPELVLDSQFGQLP